MRICLPILANQTLLIDFSYATHALKSGLLDKVAPDYMTLIISSFSNQPRTNTKCSSVVIRPSLQNISYIQDTGQFYIHI